MVSLLSTLCPSRVLFVSLPSPWIARASNLLLLTQVIPYTPQRKENKYHQLMWYNSLWFWRWLPHRLSKCQSLSTTILFGSTLTQTITFQVLMKCFSLVVFRVLEACKSWTQFLHGLTSWITWHKFLFTHQNFHHSFINPRDDQCGSITINTDFIKNRFEAITMVNMETSATQDKETAQRRKEILMTKNTDVSGCLITFWPLTGLCFRCARCPLVPNFCCYQETRKSEFLHTNNNYAGHPRFYRVRTLSCPQFSLEHSLDLLTSSSSSSHSSLLMVNRTKKCKNQWVYPASQC